MPVPEENKGDSTMSEQIKLMVNDAPIKLKYFTEAFIVHVISGILESLKGTSEIENLELSIGEDRQVIINLNDTVVPVSPFANKIITDTITGMVSTLKGASEINRLNLVINK